MSVVSLFPCRWCDLGPCWAAQMYGSSMIASIVPPGWQGVTGMATPCAMRHDQRRHEADHQARDHRRPQCTATQLFLFETIRIWKSHIGTLEELNLSGNSKEKVALLLALRKARKLDTSTCLVCNDVIVIYSTLIACPVYGSYLLILWCPPERCRKNTPPPEKKFRPPPSSPP